MPLLHKINRDGQETHKRPGQRLLKAIESPFHMRRKVQCVGSESHRSYPVEAGKYQILEQIGRGGSGTAYKAICLEFNEVVAIKSIDLETLKPDYIEQLIKKECRTLMLLSHPNVLGAHCSFMAGQCLWEVMPFMAEGSLYSILRGGSARQGLKESVVATVLKETLKALDYLHKEGHIHRDVKSGNILVDSDGSIKLADYGVSAYIYESGDRDKMIRHTLTGSVSWMAPEVILAERVRGYDCKADIWSLGITAIELAEGRPPYSGSQPMKVMADLAKGIVPRIPDTKFSKCFREMVHSCLEYHPAKRPSAEKLLKHPFIKNNAHSPHYLVQHLLRELPELSQRLKIVGEEECQLLAAKMQSLAPMAEEEKEAIEWDFM